MLNKKSNLILLKKVIPWLLLFGIAFFLYFNETVEKKEEPYSFKVLSGSEINSGEEMERQNEQEEELSEKFIFVDVSGAVKKPMVVKLPEGSRVFEALDLVGGVNETADTKTLNLASVLMDGEKIYVQTKEEVGKEETSFAMDCPIDAEQTSKVNLNKADSTALQKLKGVGPSTAQRILDYRKEYGCFKNIEELKNVKGIGEKTFEKLKNELYVN